MYSLFQNFFNLSCFTNSVSQVEQFSTSYNTTSYNLDTVDSGRVYGPCSFNANAGSDTSYCESFSDAAALSFDNNAFEHLQSFSCTLYYFSINTDCVANVKRSYFAFQLFIFQISDDIHCNSSLFTLEVLTPSL